jgi:hypothetical protein
VIAIANRCESPCDAIPLRSPVSRVPSYRGAGAALGRVTPSTNKRSVKKSRRRRGRYRVKTISLCRRAMRSSLQRCAAADAEREQENESGQNRDHAPRRYAGGAGNSSISLDRARTGTNVGSGPSNGWKCLPLDSIESCGWSVQLTSTVCADYDAQCRRRQKYRPIARPPGSDCLTAGLTSMDCSGCSSSLTLIACAGCRAPCRLGQRDKPIASPLRRDWQSNAPAENYRATNCSCASPDRKAYDDSLNNRTRVAAERISLRQNLQRLPASGARRSRPRCQAPSWSPGAAAAQNVSFKDEPARFDSSGADRPKKCGSTRPAKPRSRAPSAVDYPADLPTL